MLSMSPALNIYPSSEQNEILTSTFGDRIQRFVSLSRYTSARIGGIADWLLVVDSADQLRDSASQFWRLDIPFLIIGGGSNILISDSGVRQPVILNKARNVDFNTQQKPTTVVADSGVNFGLLARQCASRGLSGLEWAAGIPGTVGGAVFGNAGAHGGDVAGSLRMATILHRTDKGIVRESWYVDDLGFDYRSSVFKQNPDDFVILAAEFELQLGNAREIQTQMDTYVAYRRRTQPPGASMGSMFKNPTGDYAGRLIEAAGLKGTRIGGAEISSTHANFFVNYEGATASDVAKLIQTAQEKVKEKFGIELELEIALVGEW